MLLSSCTTVDRVEKLSEGAAYCLLELRVTAVTAFGTVRAELAETRAADDAALLATAPAEERIASISGCVYEWTVCARGRKSFLPAPQEQRNEEAVEFPSRNLCAFIS